MKSNSDEFEVAFATIKSAPRPEPKLKFAITDSESDIKKKPKPKLTAKKASKAGPASKRKKNGKVKKQLHPLGLKLKIKTGTDYRFV